MWGFFTVQRKNVYQQRSYSVDDFIAEGFSLPRNFYFLQCWWSTAASYELWVVATSLPCFLFKSMLTFTVDENWYIIGQLFIIGNLRVKERVNWILPSIYYVFVYREFRSFLRIESFHISFCLVVFNFSLSYKCTLFLFLF